MGCWSSKRTAEDELDDLNSERWKNEDESDDSDSDLDDSESEESIREKWKQALEELKQAIQDDDLSKVKSIIAKGPDLLR